MKRFLLILCALVLALLCRSAAVPDAHVLTGAAGPAAASNTHGSGRSSCGKLLAGGAPDSSVPELRLEEHGASGVLIPSGKSRSYSSGSRRPGRRDRHGLRSGAPLSECVLHAAFLRREPFPSRIPPESPDLIQHHFPCRNPSSAIFILLYLTIMALYLPASGRLAARGRERVALRSEA